MSFTHLHIHTQYSLLDGANYCEELASLCKEFGMGACAITDHGWMAGVIDFYKSCKKADIKPLIGVEAYVTDDEDGKKKETRTRDNMHMVLIAKDNTGYSRLLTLVSEGALNNFYYKPRIHRNKLRALGGHCIATTACLGGIIPRRLEFEQDQYGRCIRISGGQDIVERELNFYTQVFGEDFYLEIQDWDDETQRQQLVNQYLLELGRKHKLPFVITSDAHYLRKEDYKLHELLMAMQLKTTVDQYQDQDEMKYGPHFYVKSPDEMLAAAKKWDCEEAYYNTEKIAEKCNVEITLGKYQEAVFRLEEAEDYEEFKQWQQSTQSKPLRT